MRGCGLIKIPTKILISYSFNKVLVVEHLQGNKFFISKVSVIFVEIKKYTHVRKHKRPFTKGITRH